MDLHTALITIIAVCAVLTVLSVIFNWLLTPVKESIMEIKSELKAIRKELNGKNTNS